MPLAYALFLGVAYWLVPIRRPASAISLFAQYASATRYAVGIRAFWGRLLAWANTAPSSGYFAIRSIRLRDALCRWHTRFFCALAVAILRVLGN